MRACTPDPVDTVGAGLRLGVGSTITWLNAGVQSSATLG